MSSDTWYNCFSCAVLMFAVGGSVRKVSGERDVGESGRIEDIMTNAKGDTILSIRVFELYGCRHASFTSNGLGTTATYTVRTKSWLASECEVVSEAW